MMNQPVEDPERSAHAFELYLQNQSVVYAAVWRTGLVKTKDEPLFDELVDEGMWAYHDFYLKYPQALDSDDALTKFNALALQAVSWALKRYLGTERAHAATNNEVLNDPAIGRDWRDESTPDWLVDEEASKLYGRLSRVEKQVFRLLYDEELSPSEIVKQTGRSRVRISQIRKQIQAKYLALQAEEDR